MRRARREGRKEYSIGRLATSSSVEGEIRIATIRLEGEGKRRLNQ